MTQVSGTPFESIESTHEFITLLAQTIYETKLDIEADVEREANGTVTRRLEALRLALYTLDKLELHLNRSRRILNDLRTLRRLLFEERSVAAASPQRPQYTAADKKRKLKDVKSGVVSQDGARPLASA